MTPDEVKQNNDERIRQKVADLSISTSDVSDTIDEVIDLIAFGEPPEGSVDYTVINVLNTPPGSPTEDDQYRVGNAPTGDWADDAKKITRWNGTAWEMTAPNVGDYVFQTTDAKTYQFKSDFTWKISPGICILHNGNVISNGVKIGTRNDKDFVFIRNKLEAMRISDDSGILTLLLGSTTSNFTVITKLSFGVADSTTLKNCLLDLTGLFVKTDLLHDGKFSSYGLKLPSYADNSERNEIPSPETNQLIWNNTLSFYEYFNGSQWVSLKGYKSLVAYVYQSGTSEPTMEIMNNDFGSLSWSRAGAGAYQLVSVGFTVGKTIVNGSKVVGAGAASFTNLGNNFAILGRYAIYVDASNAITISVRDASNAAADLSTIVSGWGIYLEVKVYP